MQLAQRHAVAYCQRWAQHCRPISSGSMHIYTGKMNRAAALPKMQQVGPPDTPVQGALPGISLPCALHSFMCAALANTGTILNANQAARPQQQCHMHVQGPAHFMCVNCLWAVAAAAAAATAAAGAADYTLPT